MGADRGEYQSFFVAMLDDADLQALDHVAFRVLMTLRLSLGGPGIGIPTVLQVCQRSNCTPAEYETACRVLEQPKPDDVDGYGWIVRDRNLVWVVNGLRYHPNLFESNPKHRAYVEDRVLKPLGDKPIVQAFRRRYAGWLSSPSPDQTRGGSAPDASPRDTVSDTVSDHGRRKTEAIADSHTQRSGETGHAPDADLVTGDEALDAAPLAPLLRRLKSERYGTAPAERWADVVRQLRELLSPEGTLARRGERRLRATPDVLARALQRALDESIRMPDRTIVVVLQKCRDGNAVVPIDRNGRLPSEAAVVREREERSAEARDTAEQQRAAEAWLVDRPDVQAAIERVVEPFCPRSAAKASTFGALARAEMVRTKTLEAFRASLGTEPAPDWMPASPDLEAIAS